MDDTTAELAHVVLPDHTFLERYEDSSPAPAIPRAIVGIRQPVVAPLHDTRSTGDVVIDLAKRVGGTVSESFPWGSFREAVEERLLGLHAARRGSVRGDSPREFLDSLYRAGVWTDSGEAVARPVTFRFPTSWSEPAWSGSEASFPLHLVIVRPLGYAVGSGANQPWLQHLRPHLGARPWKRPVMINPAAAPSLSDGDRVVVESEHGTVEARVHLDPRLDETAVVMAMGGGHAHFGRTAKRVGGVNPLVLAAPGFAPGSGANILSGTRVRIRKGGS
jgi:anaerobic selenocysteine-containing dehydrogenase